MARMPTPGEMAVLDQIHANASGFIDSMLSTAVTVLQSGRPAHELFSALGGGLHRTEDENGPIGPVQYRVLLAVAVARLAGMRHAVEQLADQFTATIETLTDAGMKRRTRAYVECVAELRKLVDDHG